MKGYKYKYVGHDGFKKYNTWRVFNEAARKHYLKFPNNFQFRKGYDYNPNVNDITRIQDIQQEPEVQKEIKDLEDFFEEEENAFDEDFDEENYDDTKIENRRYADRDLVYETLLVHNNITGILREDVNYLITDNIYQKIPTQEWSEKSSLQSDVQSYVSNDIEDTDYYLKHDTDIFAKDNIYVEAKVLVTFSDYPVVRRISRTINNISLVDQLRQENYADSVIGIVEFLSVEELEDYDDDIDYINPEEQKPRELDMWFGKVSLNASKENCLYKYLKDNWKVSIKRNNSLKQEIKNIKSIKQLKKFCINQCSLQIHDISGKCIYKYSFKKKHNSLKKVCFMLHDNHIYPITGRLNKEDFKINEFEYVEDVTKEFLSYVYNENKFCHVWSNDVSGIKSFAVKTNNGYKCITGDSSTQVCYDILKYFGCENEVSYDLSVFNLFEKLTGNKNIQKLKSFVPKMSTFKVPGYNYINEELIKKNVQYTDIDKNKCYPSALLKLPYLISCDIHTSKILKPDTIVDHYMYYIEVEKSTIHQQMNGFLPGYAIKNMQKDKLNPKIIYGMETKKHPNVFRNLINNLITLANNNKNFSSTIKLAMNIFIGKMECVPKKKTLTKLRGVFDKDVAKTDKKLSIKLDNNYSVCYEYDNGTTESRTRECDRQTITHLKNMKPIAIQVKHQARMNVLNTIRKLKIPRKRILQIKTDSIVFHGPEEIFLNSDIDDWKIQNDTKFLKTAKKRNIISSTKPYYTIKNNNEMHLGYAGCGKTYNILKRIKKLNDYIVLTPTFASLLEYKKHNINSDTIQKFTAISRVPKESIIIIDEIGMVDRKGWSIIAKATLLNKKIIAYGDFKQLLPVGVSTKEDDRIQGGKPLYNKIIRMTLFNEETFSKSNYRNKFSNNYYDKLINNKINIKNEVLKHSTKSPDKAHKIVCYRNKTVDKYNNIKLKQLNFDHITDVGVRIMCYTNKYFEKYGFTKNTEFTITDKHNDIITIKDDINSEYTIKISDFYKRGSKTEPRTNPIWKPAYATTLHRLQGSQVNSYFFPKDDINFITQYKNDTRQQKIEKCRFAYTLISRLKN